MNYETRIREIQSAFIMGYQDRDTCIKMFEELLHDYGLLPEAEQLDRAITNECFLVLLNAAKDATAGGMPIAPSAIERYKVADSVKKLCPVCTQPAMSLYDRVQVHGVAQPIPVDPPRCQACMTKWVEEKYGPAPSSKAPEPRPSVHLDNSPVVPLDLAEVVFFLEYERQMMEKP